MRKELVKNLKARLRKKPAATIVEVKDAFSLYLHSSPIGRWWAVSMLPKIIVRARFLRHLGCNTIRVYQDHSRIAVTAVQIVPTTPEASDGRPEGCAVKAVDPRQPTPDSVEAVGAEMPLPFTA